MLKKKMHESFQLHLNEIKAMATIVVFVTILGDTRSKLKAAQK